MARTALARRVWFAASALRRHYGGSMSHISPVTGSMCPLPSAARAFSDGSAAWTDGPQAFETLLVANRGEIACRVLHTAKKLGLHTVAVYSDPDMDAPHVQLAHSALRLGPAVAAQSYLNVDLVMEAINSSGAQAVHPGYGFLSENAAFVKRLEEEGKIFVGPGSFAISAMGDKVESKLLAAKAGVHTIPGHVGVVDTEEEALVVAKDIGYPVMIKASAGGGGKGMRVAWDEQGVREGFRLSAQEAVASFGDGRLFLEKFVEAPRHIEIQVLADNYGNTVFLSERECSLQRRNQKVIEEAPSMFLDEATRWAMGEQACQLAKAVGYRSAGTVEFLVDKHKNFYFLEMNTRLQVEHPVTEAITGVDLVEQMLRVAAGEKLSLNQAELAKPKGWAVESRIYAEDPSRGYLPSTGRLIACREPATHELVQQDGCYVRVDSGVKQGSEISIHYDPMVSKLITYGPDRPTAMALMRDALDSYVIRGVVTNTLFLRTLVSDPDVLSGDFTTKFLEEKYPDGLGDTAGSTTVAQEEEMVALASMLYMEKRWRMFSAASNNASSPHTHSAAQMLAQPLGVKKLMGSVGGGETGIDVHVSRCNTHGGVKVTLPGRDIHLERIPLSDRYTPLLHWCKIDGRSEVFQVVKHKPYGVVIQYKGAEREIKLMTPTQHSLDKWMPPEEKIDVSKLLQSPMPGNLVSLAVGVGDRVKPGDELAVVEAMKMQNVLRAATEGVVKAVLVEIGSVLVADQNILEFE